MASTVTNPTTTELVSPTSSDHRLRQSPFEAKRRMVLAITLGTSSPPGPTGCVCGGVWCEVSDLTFWRMCVGRRMREVSTPRYVREQEEALQHLQTEAEMAEEEARKLEEEIRRMEEDLDDTDDDEEDDDYYNELDHEDSDSEESEDEEVEEEEEEEESDDDDEDDDDEGEDSEEVEVVVEEKEEKVERVICTEVVPEQQQTPVRKRSRGNSLIKEMLVRRRRFTLIVLRGAARDQLNASF